MLIERDVLNEDLERMWFYSVGLAVCVADCWKERGGVCLCRCKAVSQFLPTYLHQTGFACVERLH